MVGISNLGAIVTFFGIIVTLVTTQQHFYHDLLKLGSSVPCIYQYILPLVSTNLMEEFTLNPVDSYVPHDLLEADLEAAITGGVGGGVHVLALPPDSGKTAAIRRVLRRLQKQRIIGNVLCLPAFTDINRDVNLNDQIFPYLHWSAHTHFSHYLTPGHVTAPFIIFFDQYDKAFTHPYFERFIVALAEDSRQTKLYRVLFSTNDPVYAKQMLSWNGGSKIKKMLTYPPSYYKWNITQVDTLIKQIHPRLTKNNNINTDKIRELALLAGTPGYLLTLLYHSVKFSTDGDNGMTLFLESDAEFNAMKRNTSWYDFH